MKKLIVLVGNIGTGKSTLASTYQRLGFVIISRDQLRYGIGLGNYIFNLDYEPVIWETELSLFRGFIRLGVDIVIDEIGMDKATRRRYIPYAKTHGYKVTALELPRLSKKDAVDRRMKSPHGNQGREVWEGVFDKFEEMYEAPDIFEGIDYIMKTKGDDAR